MISVSPSGRVDERKARDSNPHAPLGAHCSANRPGKPYPATFLWRVDHRGVEPRSPGCKPGVFPLDERPIANIKSNHPGRTRTCDILLVRQASWPLDDGTDGNLRSRTGGSRTHRSPDSRPGRYAGSRTVRGRSKSSRPRYRSGRVGLMRANRAPARLGSR
jgi:hypothetical protein